jgi:hypothetical protein
MPIVTAPTGVPAVPAVVTVAASIRTAAALAVIAVASSIGVTTALARVRPALAAATTIPAALSVGNVVVDRQEGSRQTAKERDQCDHDDCQYQIPKERCHGWTLLYDRRD